MGLAERVPAPAAAAGARLLRALPAGRGERRSPRFRAARFLDAAAVPRARALRAPDGGPHARGARGALDGRGAGRDRHARCRRASCSAAARPHGHRGAPAPRHRHVPAGRPAAEVRHRLDGALARAALAAPRPSRRRARPGAARPPEAARARGQDRAAARVRRRSPAERLARAARAASAFRSRRGSAASCGRSRATLLLGEPARSRGWFRTEAVERLLDEHAAGRADNGHRLWTLVMLELWQRAHVDEPVADCSREPRASPTPRSRSSAPLPRLVVLLHVRDTITRLSNARRATSSRRRSSRTARTA